MSVVASTTARSRHRIVLTWLLISVALLLVYAIRRALAQFSHNRLFWQWLAACLIAQSIKVVIGYYREGRFNFKWFIGTGGMPSSHAAGVAALSTGVGTQFGFDSALFAVALIFTLIILFDAQGVRRSSGRQAAILNRMLEDWSQHRPVPEDRLNELLGHTPIEVLVGVAIGIATSLSIS